MANQDFKSESSQLFGTSGNWTSAVPLAGDNVTFTQSNAVSMDGTDQNGINLASLAVGPAYTGDIASPGAYFIISSEVVSIVGGVNMGNIYLDSGGTDAIDKVVLDSLSTAKALYLDGDIGAVIVKRGNLILVGGTVASIEVEWDGIGAKPTITNLGATITGFDGSTNFTGAMSGGTITNFEADAGTIEVTGGTVANIKLRGSSVMTHNTPTTVTSLDVKNGARFDGSEDVRAKTITYAKLHQGGDIDIDTGFDNYSVTSWDEVGDSQIKFPT